jgi:hypothetical protein
MHFPCICPKLIAVQDTRIREPFLFEEILPRFTSMLLSVLTHLVRVCDRVLSTKEHVVVGRIQGP